MASEIRAIVGQCAVACAHEDVAIVSDIIYDIFPDSVFFALSGEFHYGHFACLCVENAHYAALLLLRGGSFHDDPFAVVRYLARYGEVSILLQQELR